MTPTPRSPGTTTNTSTATKRWKPSFAVKRQSQSQPPPDLSWHAMLAAVKAITSRDDPCTEDAIGAEMGKNYDEVRAMMGPAFDARALSTEDEVGKTLQHPNVAAGVSLFRLTPAGERVLDAFLRGETVEPDVVEEQSTKPHYDYGWSPDGNHRYVEGDFAMRDGVMCQCRDGKWHKSG